MKEQQVSENGLYKRHQDCGHQEDGYEQRQDTGVCLVFESSSLKRCAIKGPEQNKTSHQNIYFVGGGHWWMKVGNVG